MHNKKYRLTKLEEFKKHNHIYDNIEGAICYIAYFNVGDRGWFLCECDDWYEPVHRIHTSTVKDIQYIEDDKIIITTENSRYTFVVETARGKSL